MIYPCDGFADFVWVEALLPSQQFFSHVRTFSLVEPGAPRFAEADTSYRPDGNQMKNQQRSENGKYLLNKIHVYT